MKDIPIFIINFNRFQPVIDLTMALVERDYHNVLIIDSASEYPPLLDWYEHKCPVPIMHLKTNEGQGVLNRLSVLYPITHNGPYVWSDGDIVPVKEAPKDFLDHMLEILKENNIPKLGLGLKLDDLPDHYKFKQEVIKHESIFTTLGHIDTKYCRVYKAPTDTTFAICNTPDCGYCQGAYRTGWPYMARHAPWYYDSNNLPDDEKMLLEKRRKDIGHWSAKS